MNYNPNAATLYRITLGGADTNDIGRIVRILSCNNVHGATIIPATGIWEDTTESSVVIEIWGLDRSDPIHRTGLVDQIARDLAFAFDQRCVLVSAVDGRALLVRNRDR